MEKKLEADLATRKLFIYSGKPIKSCTENTWTKPYQHKRKRQQNAKRGTKKENGDEINLDIIPKSQLVTALDAWLKNHYLSSDLTDLSSRCERLLRVLALVSLIPVDAANGCAATEWLNQVSLALVALASFLR